MHGREKIPYPSRGDSALLPRIQAVNNVGCALAVVANGLAWVWALTEFSNQRTLLGAAILAYVFGLRHAVDGDHIAALDKATRKITQTAERLPVGCLFFALGHSMVVAISVLSVAAAVIALGGRSQQFKAISGLIATGAPTIVLLGMSIVNFVILTQMWARFRNMNRSGGAKASASHEFQELTYHPTRISSVWKRDPSQVIFRLGIGNVTEVTLLGILSAQAAERGSVSSCLVLPVLFTAALILIDTTEGMSITYACSHALANPLRRSWYYLVVAVASALVALFIFDGGIAQCCAGSWPLIKEFDHWLVAVDYVGLFFFVLSLVVSAQVCRREYRCRTDH
jgi:nickel/cobalt transporter (NiCoT) family protein